jgi:UDP-N-acetylmuramoyl-tripeptide--D-alanyl-D-alanine ligase
MNLTLAEAAIGARAVLEAAESIANAGALVATGYSIDSRTVASGELFFAVKGERLDGHDFIAAAVERGAVAAVVSRDKLASLSDAALAVPLLIAEDSLVALQALASHVRRQWGKRVVAVTGSAGKTTTKEAIAAALSAKYNVLKSIGNLNNNYGLPLQLLRLQPEHEFAVVEMGMNHLGEIAALCRIASPDWGVVTNVGNAHVENFTEGQAGIARAKYELIAALPATGVAFLNCSDAYVSQFGRGFPGKVVYFGVGPCGDPAILDVKEDTSGLDVRFRAGEHEGSFHLNLLGAHNAQNAIAGLAVALQAEVDRDAAVAAIEKLTPGSKRGEVLEIAGATILNDSYNSNPEALLSMIHTLAARPAQRRILIAGEMLELGDHASMLHAACGKAAAEAGIDLIVGVRGNAQHLAAAACLCGAASIFLPDAHSAGDWLSKNLKPGDVVLIKGSRGVQLERAIEMLKNQIAISSSETQ